MDEGMGGWMDVLMQAQHIDGYTYTCRHGTHTRTHSHARSHARSHANTPMQPTCICHIHNTVKAYIHVTGFGCLCAGSLPACVRDVLLPGILPETQPRAEIIVHVTFFPKSANQT